MSLTRWPFFAMLRAFKVLIVRDLMKVHPTQLRPEHEWTLKDSAYHPEDKDRLLLEPGWEKMNLTRLGSSRPALFGRAFFFR